MEMQVAIGSSALMQTHGDGCVAPTIALAIRTSQNKTSPRRDIAAAIHHRSHKQHHPSGAGAGVGWDSVVLWPDAACVRSS